MRVLRKWFAAALLPSLAACGGGDDGAPTPPPPPPPREKPVEKPADRPAAAFAEPELHYTIERDYDQRIAVVVANGGSQPVDLFAELGPLSGSLLGGFVDAGGSADRPLRVPAGGKADLTAALFAQDADSGQCHTHVVLKSAPGGESLARADLAIYVRRPKFDLKVDVGPPHPDTLARTITLFNNGQALTDLSVAAEPSLNRRVRFAPLVEHAFLSAGSELRFDVEPILDTAFRKFQGDIVIRAAGQQTIASIAFELPRGQNVFIADSFSTTAYESESWYCTNRPNVDTPMSGPGGGLPPSDPPKPPHPCPKASTELFGLPKGNYRGSDVGWRSSNEKIDNCTVKIEDYHHGFDLSSRKWTDKDGNGKVDKDEMGKPESVLFTAGVTGTVTRISTEGVRTIEVTLPNGNKLFYLHSGWSFVEVGQAVKPDTPLGMTSNAGAEFSEIHLHVEARDPQGRKIHPDCVIAGMPNQELSPQNDAPLKTHKENARKDHVAHCNKHGKSSNKNSTAPPKKPNATTSAPKGGKVREAYEHYRAGIYGDNRPEAAWAFTNAAGLQVWHSNLGYPRRRIIFQAWELKSGKPLTDQIALTDGFEIVQWPAVAALDDGRAVAVWESTDVEGQGPGLSYSVSGAGYVDWSAPSVVPGTEEGAHVDPVIAGSTIVWQQGEGADARVLIASIGKDGALSAPAKPQGMPQGASRPIARVDRDGSLHLAFQTPDGAVHYARIQGGVATTTRLSPEGVEAGEPDLLVTASGVHAAFRSGKSWESNILYRVLKSGQWSDPVEASPEGVFAEYPALYEKAGNIGVEFYGDARGKPQGRSMLKRFDADLRGGRFEAPRRLLTDYPAITETWLQVNFRLRNGRNNYKPHDLAVLFNGFEIFRRTGTIPEGTYRMRVDPSMLSVEMDGTPENVVGLRTAHLPESHYSSAAGFRLEARHAFLERFVVAASQEEADRKLQAGGKWINHSRPDIGLFAVDGSPLRAAPVKGSAVAVTIDLMNIGEGRAQNVQVGVFERLQQGQPSGPTLSEPIALERLEPGEAKRIEVRFAAARSSIYYIVARIDGEDWNPKNNVHILSFEPSKAPTIRSKEPDWTALEEMEPAALWRILDESGQKEIARIEHGRISNPVPPGRYRLALKRHAFEGEEVVWPEPFEHRAGAKLPLSWRTSIEIVPPEWAPAPARWEAVVGDKVVQWGGAGRLVLPVPPGEYTLTVQWAAFKGERVHWPTRIQVGRHKRAVVRLDSGVAIETATWLPARDPDHGWWGVVAAGGEPSKPVQWSRHRDLLVLAPGEYDVYWVHDLDLRGAPMRVAAAVKVHAGSLATVEVNSGIRIETALWVPKRDPNHGWWGVTDPGGKGSKPIQWARERDTLVLAPGEYDVYWVQNLDLRGSPQRIASSVKVEAGRLATVAVNSALKIEAASWVPKRDPNHGWWGVTAPGARGNEPMQWARALDTLMLPPGEYDVYWVQNLDLRSSPLRIASGIKVEPGALSKVLVGSCVKLMVPDWVPKRDPNHGWWGVVAPGGSPADPLQWSRDADTLLLPPGEYDACWVQGLEHRSRPIVLAKAVVKEGELTNLTVASGLRLASDEGLPPLDQDHGWWGVTAAGGSPNERVHWSRSSKDALLLPPGEYDVYWKAGLPDRPLRLRAGVKVEAGKLTEVERDR